ncbi:MAG TPA: prepilin-type N-terminal cleavage/methylation domain-containing protein [Anaerohalosphaeraceae bacterium]|nr:prepilin-type N-terminal cleavage/methylation domain-containing protein [Anaerohalosphaeraceae bacterium]HOL30843.1 prepilin-type N-terminal cleavage/methylation domain-containing protein [Anaerohalosphaeraceae bacterium]HOM77290.1 prepilin-type N-terminal cleavage/methylation domain-containing protein [Anaerohalosphaeraceae bacterium]HPC64900.1 prepilin-type N-terminal cleavage/methylation domain-containing protein [Anaerohalosphaeraceae bacterium]HPO69201.1 prepilin-type N-terminal cleavag
MKHYSVQADRCGFTLIELMTAIALVSIVILSIGFLLADGQRALARQRSRVFSDAAADGFAIQKVFDAVCRKASMRKAVIADEGRTLELYYWNAGSTASSPENYARFYQSDRDVFIQHGRLLPGTWQPDADAPVSTILLARQVDTIAFVAEGTSVQMFLTFEDPDLMPVVCSSVRHND